MTSRFVLLQGAQLSVLAFPHDLRVFGVADCVALDDGQPSAAELLARSASHVIYLHCIDPTLQRSHVCNVALDAGQSSAAKLSQ